MCKLFEMIANDYNVQGLSCSLYWCVKAVCCTAIILTLMIMVYKGIGALIRFICQGKKEKNEIVYIQKVINKCNRGNSNDETEVVVPCEKNSKISINVQAKNNNSLKLFLDNQNQKGKDETDQKQNNNPGPKANNKDPEVGDQGDSDPKKE